MHDWHDTARLDRMNEPNIPFKWARTIRVIAAQQQQQQQQQQFKSTTPI